MEFNEQCDLNFCDKRTEGITNFVLVFINTLNLCLFKSFEIHDNLGFHFNHFIYIIYIIIIDNSSILF